MGVGTPADLLEGIARGVDMFDCVMPTRNGRNALAFTDSGVIRIRNAKHRQDPRGLDPTCDCPAERHSRAYLRHLFQAGEMLGPILLSLHNLRYYQRVMQRAREAIAERRFVEFHQEMKQRWAKPWRWIATPAQGWGDRRRRRRANRRPTLAVPPDSPAQRLWRRSSQG